MQPKSQPPFNEEAAARFADVQVLACPCGNDGCRTFGLTVGSFDQGCGWTKASAEYLAQAARAYPALFRSHWQLFETLATVYELISSDAIQVPDTQYALVTRIADELHQAIKLYPKQEDQ